MTTRGDQHLFPTRKAAVVAHRGGLRSKGRAYPIGKFWLAYGLALLAMVAAIVIAWPMVLLAYPAAGASLSRYIGRRIEWWTQGNSVENVFLAKLNTIIYWPTAVPLFLVQ